MEERLRWRLGRASVGDHGRRSTGRLDKRHLRLEALEMRQLLSAASSVQPAQLVDDTFVANAFDLVDKAQPDEWYVGEPGGPYVSSAAPAPTPEAIKKVNQDYVWGMVRSGNFIWLGTAGNGHLMATAAASGNPALISNSVQVAEGAASTYPGIPDLLRSVEGDWRPPTIHRYNLTTGRDEDLTAANSKLRNDPLLKCTLGLRSAGATDTIVFLAGPNMYTSAINMFAFNAKTGQYLGSSSFSQYGDIRRWVTCKPPGATTQQLYTAVLQSKSITGEGTVLRWTGTLRNPFSFQEVGQLDLEGAYIVQHAGRLFVSTWPLWNGSLMGNLGFRSSAKAGIWMSPPLTKGGLTTRDNYNWQKVWSIDDYEPDPVIARSYGCGALASFDGYLYWGTMQVARSGTAILQESYPDAQPPQDPNDPAKTLALDQVTGRPTVVFRGFHAAPSSTVVDSNVRLLYGDTAIWKYTPPGSDPQSQPEHWDLVPSNNAAALGTPLGPAGFGVPTNFYTWSMEVQDNKLYLGTQDVGTTYYCSFYPTANGNVDQLEQTLESQHITNDFRMGADLYCFSPGDGPAVPVSLEGAGDPLNMGIRNMVSTPQGLFLGTANTSNLLTAAYDPATQPLKAGGWELVRLNSISGQSLGPVESAALDNLSPSAGDLWYSVQTMQAGRLIATATLQRRDRNTVQLALFEDAKNGSPDNRGPLALSKAGPCFPWQPAAAQIDQQVSAGQTYYIRVRGTTKNADLKIQNLAAAGASDRSKAMASDAVIGGLAPASPVAALDLSWLSQAVDSRSEWSTSPRRDRTARLFALLAMTEAT